MKIEKMNNKAIMMEMGQRFLLARLNEGLEQLELADKAGVNVSTVQSLEGGKRSVGLEKLISILRALGKLHELDNFIPKPPVRSTSLLTTKNQVRKRAAKSKKHYSSNEPFEWKKVIARADNTKE